MAEITTVGLDLAKSWFQVHGADAQGRPLLRKKLARGKLLAFFAGLPRCLEPFHSDRNLVSVPTSARM